MIDQLKKGGKSLVDIIVATIVSVAILQTMMSYLEKKVVKLEAIAEAENIRVTELEKAVIEISTNQKYQTSDIREIKEMFKLTIKKAGE